MTCVIVNVIVNISTSIFRRFTGNRVTVCLTENIKAGNQINNSYGKGRNNYEYHE